MKNFIALIILNSFSLAVFAQNVPDAPKKDIQVKDIWATYSFFAAGVSDFNFMKNGLYYTELEATEEGAEIIEYNLGTGLKTRTLHFEKKEAGLNGYEISADEKKLLLEIQTEKIYRYSSQALQIFLNIETYRPIFARVAFDNWGSQKVLEKCNFIRIGNDWGFANARQAEIEEFIYQLA